MGAGMQDAPAAYFVAADGVGPTEARRFASHLGAMREPSLAGPGAPRGVRFLWLRARHNPLTVRAALDEGPFGTLHVKRASGWGGHPPKATPTLRLALAGVPAGQAPCRLAADPPRALSRREGDAIARMAGRLSGLPPPGGAVIDGSDWLFEVVLGARRVFVRRSPAAGPHRDLGLLMLDLAGFEPTEDDPLC